MKYSTRVAKLSRIEEELAELERRKKELNKELRVDNKRLEFKAHRLIGKALVEAAIAGKCALPAFIEADVEVLTKDNEIRAEIRRMISRIEASGSTVSNLDSGSDDLVAKVDEDDDKVIDDDISRLLDQIGDQ